MDDVPEAVVGRANASKAAGRVVGGLSPAAAAAARDSGRVVGVGGTGPVRGSAPSDAGAEIDEGIAAAAAATRASSGNERSTERRSGTGT
jgi:hypothetical protein